MRVIGIDPGSRACGYAVVEEDARALRFVDGGAIRPKASLPVHERLHRISEEISAKIERFSPACMSVEKVFVAKNSKSALHLGQARGAALVAAGGKGIEVYEYSSTMVKKSVTGNGRASKDDIQKIVSIMFGGAPFETADEADAVAIAVCHINNAKSGAKIPNFTARRAARRRRFTADDFPAERKSC